MPKIQRTQALLTACALSIIVGALTATSAGAEGLPWAKRITGYFPVADGSQLHYSVLLPKTTGRFPVIVNYSGYDPGSIGGVAYQEGKTAMWPKLDAHLLEAGFAVMGVNMPGFGCSTGPTRFIHTNWATDGAQAIEWAGTQPWSTGAVGMDNWSFAGLSQVLVAEQKPAHLRAIAPGMVVTDAQRDVGHPGGVENNLFPVAWWAYIQEQWSNALQTARAEGDTQCEAAISQHLAEGQTESPPRVGAEHPYVDSVNVESWRDASQIKIPVFSVEDWEDEATGPRGGYYQSRLNPKTTWFLGTNGRHDIYDSAILREKLTSFFDTFLKGEKNGFTHGPHVWLWEEATAPKAPLSEDPELEASQPGFVIALRRLPVKVKPVTLALHSGNLMTTKPARAGESPDTLEYPHEGPAVNADLTTGEESWETKAVSPATTPDYTTPALAQDYTFLGPGSANLWVTSSFGDADLQLTLTELRPDGKEVYVQRGWIQLSQSATDPEFSTVLLPFHPQTEASLLKVDPGTPILARVEVQKFSHTFRRGSSIRMWIDTPSETGEWGFKTVSGTGTISILHDPSHPSALVLGLLKKAGPAPVSPAPCGALIAEPCRTSPAPAPKGSERLR